MSFFYQFVYAGHHAYLMRLADEMQITIYTDGACDIHADNQPGGWAAILCASDECGNVIKESIVRGGREMTTNNQMELTAVIEGLKALKRSSNITVVSDSRYVIDIAGKAKKKPQECGSLEAILRIAGPP